MCKAELLKQEPSNKQACRHRSAVQVFVEVPNGTEHPGGPEQVRDFVRNKLQYDAYFCRTGNHIIVLMGSLDALPSTCAACVPPFVVRI
jgi:hypothetical protein